MASSSRDRVIKIWNVKEGKCLADEKIPANTGIHRPKSTSQERDKRPIWIALNWTNGDHILSSGLSGELLLWDVSYLLTFDSN